MLNAPTERQHVQIIAKV